MGRFKPAPAPIMQPQQSLEPAVQAFISGAATRFPSGIAPAPKGPPWSAHDPSAIARKGINLRLNDWELAVLRHASEREGCSIQQVLKAILTPGLQTYTRAEGNSNHGTGTGTGTGTM